MYKFSIIIPFLNEEKNISKQSALMQFFMHQGHEVIVVDGGSSDKSVELATQIGYKCICTLASRGYQLHAGAKLSRNDILVFLHADTLLPPTALESITSLLTSAETSWGRFNVKFNNNKLIFKVIAWFMNKRSCITGMVTGDHTLFIKRDTYFACGGFADIPIMEDIEFCKRLKKYSRPICLADTVITSSRKWEHQGVINTILLMWRLRMQYFFGVPAERLAKQYYSK